MRKYHIFQQEAKILRYGENGRICRLLDFSYLFTVHGTRELYDVFGKGRGLRFAKGFSDCGDLVEIPYRMGYESYLILDDKWSVRDYYDLTGKLIKKRTIRIKHQKKYLSRSFSHARRKKNDISPDELKEIKGTYGSSFHPGRRQPDASGAIRKVQRNWKYQTKSVWQHR